MHFLSAVGATHSNGRRRSAHFELLSQEMVSASFSMVNVVRRKSLLYMRQRKVKGDSNEVIKATILIRLMCALKLYRAFFGDMKRCYCVVAKLRKSN